MSIRRTRIVGIAALASAALGTVWVLAGPGEAATSYPADKASVGASDTKVMQDTPASDSGPVQLLIAKLRTSTPEDLVLQVTAECGVKTTLDTPGTSSADAVGKVEMWANVDSADSTKNVVPVDASAKDDGRIVFCKREDERSNVLDPNESISTLQDTAQANAFNWTAWDMGNGIHTIRVWGELTTTASTTNGNPSGGSTPNATSEAVVTRRTLTIDPTKAIQQPQ